MNILLLVFLVYLQRGSAIHCIECTSSNNTFCVDPSMYDQETLSKYLLLTECGVDVDVPRELNFFCRKIIQTVYHQGLDSQVVVVRGCGWERNYEDCYRVSTDSHLETVCQCFHDGCNGAGNHQNSIWMISGFISLFLSYRLLIYCFV